MTANLLVEPSPFYIIKIVAHAYEILIVPKNRKLPLYVETTVVDTEIN